jgi:hypothetical protein
MGDVISIGKSARKNRLRERNRGKTLCRRGFHKWAIDTAHEFDVKEGRLATVSRCERCGATRTEFR